MSTDTRAFFTPAALWWWLFEDVPATVEVPAARWEGPAECLWEADWAPCTIVDSSETGLMLRMKDGRVCERYNGTGHLRFHPDVPTPYLWAAIDTVETPGKYIADGKWSATAKSSQIGIAAILLTLQDRGEITLPV